MTRTSLQKIWHDVVPRLGISAAGQHRLKELSHRTGLREDVAVRVYDDVRRIMARSSKALSDLDRMEFTGGPVLVWAMRGGLQVNAVDAVLAQALRLRGVDARVVLCDSAISVCENRAIDSYPGEVVSQRASARLCDRCSFTAERFFDEFRVPVVRLSDYLEPGEMQRNQAAVEHLDRDAIFSLERDEVPLGPAIKSSVFRFFRAVTIPDTPTSREIIRDAGASALTMYSACARMFEDEKPRALVGSHGIYILWGIVTELARRRGVPATIWGNGYRQSTLRFTKDRDIMNGILEEPDENWQHRELTADQGALLDDYLNNRWDGVRDPLALQSKRSADYRTILSEAGLDPRKPTVGIFPNVAWDAEVFYDRFTFRDMFEWLQFSVELARELPHLQFVVRAHPAEAISASRERACDEVRRRVSPIPPNVALIEPDANVNTYRLAEGLSAAVVYASQVGLELACRGIPTIVTGGALYRGKSFTIDATSAAEYAGLLRNAEKIPTPAAIEIDRARRYAYHFYFRRMYPFPFIVREGSVGLKELRLDSLDDLRPGVSPELDGIMEAIFQPRDILA